MKELRIWREAGIEPKGSWYLRAGAGMAQALRMASEKRAYTLSDRGTFLAQREGLDLVVVSEGDPLLKNRYSVMLVNPEKHPNIRHEAAQKFADFLVSPKAQQVISKFGIEKFGQPLFYIETGR